MLAPHHLDALHASAISDQIIKDRGYKTITDNAELRASGFSSAQCRAPGLLLPLHGADGGNGVYIFRPDNPRVIEDRSKKNPDGTHPCKTIKYEYPKGAAMRLDCPPTCQAKLIDPSIPLWITEGQKKADALASQGLCAIALLGVWNYVGKNQNGGTTWLADWDYISLKNRDVRIVFDSDLSSNPGVRQAQARLTEHLQRKGASVHAVYLPGGPSGKAGVDDWLAAGHTLAELEALIEAPRPAPQPAPAICELLDDVPLTINRPLTLLNGHAYAASWLYTKVTRRETLNKAGEIIRLIPPQVTTERRLFIVRDDGVIFGDGGTQPMEDLGMEIHLSEIPNSDKLWSPTGVKAYASGKRPDPGEVFRRLVEVVSRFMDFDRSLADQKTMAELIACYILATWFLDAFQVIGFLWSNGERGSGKTNLLLIVAELAYLGQLITAGGSFASLRDLADYGATLAFDDAENYSDPKNTDPDKRALLLAGNRRGVTVTLKELSGDKTWVTRHVNAFCPRLFSAIRLPDPVLSSRSIVIPLIRTADRKKANTDPLDFKEWPFDRKALIDDLWSLALANLSTLPQFDEYAGKNTNLAGRAFQPWRAILAVAAWLHQNGVTDLWARMESLSTSYQSEKPDLEAFDLTSLTIKALVGCAVANVTNRTKVTNLKEIPPYWDFTTSDITKVAKELAEDTDGEIDPDKITSQRLGHVLKKMRITKPPRPRGQKARIWRVTPGELIKLSLSYGLPIPDELQPDPIPQAEIGNMGETGNIGNTEDQIYEGAL